MRELFNSVMPLLKSVVLKVTASAVVVLAAVWSVES